MIEEVKEVERPLDPDAKRNSEMLAEILPGMKKAADAQKTEKIIRYDVPVGGVDATAATREDLRGSR